MRRWHYTQGKRLARRLVGIGAMVLGLALVGTPHLAGAAEYPEGYEPSTPEEDGNTNILARFGALSTYVNDKLEAAGGDDAPECLRNCLTVQINNILECLDQKNTYATSEPCEVDAAHEAVACDPGCSDG